MEITVKCGEVQSQFTVDTLRNLISESGKSVCGLNTSMGLPDGWVLNLRATRAPKPTDVKRVK